MSKEFSRREVLKAVGVGGGVAIGLWAARKYGLFSNFEELISGENKVTFRKDSVMEVNGNAIFPIGLYYLPGLESPESWKKLKNGGFNVINQWWINDETIRAAEKNNIYTMAYLPYAFSGEGKDKLTIGDSLKRIKQSKSFIGYFGADEPDFTLRKNLNINFLEQIMRVDSNHTNLAVFFETPDTDNSPIFDIRDFKKKYTGNQDDLLNLPDKINADDFKCWYSKMSGTEIVSFDYGQSSDVSDLVDYGRMTKKYVDKMRNGDFGEKVKAVWVTLSAHGEVPRTLKSMRFQTIDVISHGASGILWWDWPVGCSVEICPGYPGKEKGYAVHWEKLNKIGNELAEVKEGLVGREIFLGVNDSKKVNYKVTVSDKNRHYIFLTANVDDSIETINTFSPNTMYRVNGDNRIVQTDMEGKLVDNYGFMDARILVEVV